MCSGEKLLLFRRTRRVRCCILFCDNYSVVDKKANYSHMSLDNFYCIKFCITLGKSSNGSLGVLRTGVNDIEDSEKDGKT